MTTNLSYIQIITFKLQFPFVDMTSLIQIASRIKTSNVIELMDICNYKIYEKQQNEIHENLIHKLKKIKNNEILTSDDKINICQKHQEIISYFLIPHNVIWSKLIC